MGHGSADAGVITPQSTFYEQGRFGRMFPTLAPFSADTPTMRQALMELGKPGGLMDAGDGTDPITLITDATQSVDNPDNPTMAAGMTFLGQFLDHDMTFDPTSSLARRQDPESIRNFRIPALDLDSVYGGGPGVSPHLYDQSVDRGRTTLLVEDITGSAAVSLGGTRTDLPRNTQNVALIGDPRNDENLVVSQLHHAMIRFHNRVVGDVKANLPSTVTLEEHRRGAADRPLALPVARHPRVPPGDRGPEARAGHPAGRARGTTRGATDPYIPVDRSRWRPIASVTPRSARPTGRTSAHPQRTPASSSSP